MKIRLKNNSVKFRISKSELTALSQENSLDHQLAFGGPALDIFLRPTPKEQPSAVLANYSFVVAIPMTAVQQLKEDEKMRTFSFEADGKKILIEKDFKS